MTAPKLYIDIETIPGQAPWIKEMIAEKVSPPANMTKAETIAKWEEEKKPDAVNERWLKTSFDGALGEIASIAWAINDEEPKSIHRAVGDDEKVLLQSALGAISDDLSGHRISPVWVGHNVTGFDIRFIWQRCVILGLFPPINIPIDAKPWGGEVYDTLTAWGGFKSGGVCSMTDLCKAMGYEGKSDIDGSKVWEYMEVGREEEVAQYNREDVERTRLMYKRMTFKA